MPTDHRTALAKIRAFPQLIAYLRDEMGWPIKQDSFDEDDELFYEYTPEELGIDVQNAAKIQEIKRLRPLSTHQPWGIFFVKFEPKRLPVVALRRILSRVALKKRSSANSAERAVWSADDLLFISNYGEGETRQICFAHFSQNEEKQDLPILKVLGWDNLNTPLHLDHVAELLTNRLSWPNDEENENEWRMQWHSAFTLVHREVITTSKELSVELAGLARNIRDSINTVLSIENENGPVSKLMAGFKEALVHDLDEDGFADMYAQTIAYGLLSARITNPSGGTSDALATAMPVTNPFLKELMATFLDVGGRRAKAGTGPGIDFDELGVNDVIALLDAANMEAVLRDFGDRNPQEDPVIHFFEGFLQEYDKKIKKDRGVFYTPRPVVSFIVRSVDELLRAEFGLEDGLADITTWREMAGRIDDLEIPEGATPSQAFVQILDPAAGTGTFLVEVIDLINKTKIAKWRSEGHGKKKIEMLWNDYVPEHLLTRLHGYELMMAPYAIAHMKIGLKLFETGYRFESDERARVYLTNALEPTQDFSGTLAFAIPALAHEAEAVGAIKRDQRFTVVIGNPPYSIQSQNLTDTARAWVERYRYVDGERIVERNALQFEKNIQDDYVKFIRLAETTVAASGAGVTGYVTSHGFLDGATFRGMRWSLLDSYSSLHIRDLHGNANKREVAPDGSKDQNVFDISQGVAVSLFVRSGSELSNPNVNIGDLWGNRPSKYQQLAEHSVMSSPWSDVSPSAPLYLFRSSGGEVRSEFDTFTALTELMPLYSMGIKTSRDGLVLDFDSSRLAERIDLFREERFDDKTACDRFNVPLKKGWNVARAREDLRALEDLTPCISSFLYRPFDLRWIFYHKAVVFSAAHPVMQHMLDGDNLALVVTRQTKDNWDIQCTRMLVGHKSLGAYDANSVFPLYLKRGVSELDLMPESAPNMTDELIRGFKSDLGASELSAEDVFHYMYGVFHSPGYRERYSELLRAEFPRIPLPTNSDLFRRISSFGDELVALHLVESPRLDDHITITAGSCPFQVEKVSYTDDTVWIDKAKVRGFRGVPEEVWNFRIGGYQVCEKWLKDRQAKGGKNPRPGHVLTDEDIEHYQMIVVALSETIRIMAEIEGVIEAHGGWPGAFMAGGATESGTETGDSEEAALAAEKFASYGDRES